MLQYCPKRKNTACRDQRNPLSNRENQARLWRPRLAEPLFSRPPARHRASPGAFPARKRTARAHTSVPSLPLPVRPLEHLKTAMLLRTHGCTAARATRARWRQASVGQGQACEICVFPSTTAHPSGLSEVGTTAKRPSQGRNLDGLRCTRIAGTLITAHPQSASQITAAAILSHACSLPAAPCHARHHPGAVR